MMRTLIRVRHRGVLSLIFGCKFAPSHCFRSFQLLDGYDKLDGNPFSRYLSIVGAKPEKLRLKESSDSILMQKIEGALKEHQLDEAWETYQDFKRLYGFPGQILMSNLITELSYSADSKCLRRAFDLVLSISTVKAISLQPDLMTKLMLSLARAQIPAQASRIFRLMLEKKNLPSLDVLQTVFLHLVQTEIGTLLAANILGEICDCFQKLDSNKSAQTVLTKPSVTIFNLILDACMRFGSPLKGQQIIEMMPKIGVVADSQTVVIIARIHEMNGMRDELKKFKNYIDAVPVTLIRHYRQFYDCLLSLNFKFNDIDAASALLLDICGCCKSNPIQSGERARHKVCTVSIGSDNIKKGLRLQFVPVQVNMDSVCKVDCREEFIMHKNGKFVLSNKGLAMLIIGYKIGGRINELSKILIQIQDMLVSSENNTFCSYLIRSCIHLGWLETAHDILEDLKSENYPICKDSYTSLLAAYFDKNMLKEAEGLVRHIRRIRPDINVSDTMVFSSDISSKSEETRTSYLKELTSFCESDLAESIAHSIKLEDRSVFPMVHEYNSSIYFFTKAKMMGDAIMTYRKLQDMNIQPTTSTFFYMICGYSSLGMYREITILWGDIKKYMSNQNTVYNRDLYELLLLNFLRGGYFERVMELIGFMSKNSMYLDKWNYKTEFLMFHRDLYRRLTMSDAKNEAQLRRVEYVQAFRKWVGIS
ncbi:pentatricopeptide repeat-containing protein At4g17616 [Primulina huaijiensis]|uniref:pentatricopeptide repeat-containing protein At4g17616 n=1 Tax=Primulina huaijiensis TaxID=1492673 RepID=UPI003CC6E4AF